jgi:hypothetical protein
MFGIAQSDGDVMSSSMATLNSLNRFLSMSKNQE